MMNKYLHLFLILIISPYYVSSKPTPSQKQNRVKRQFNPFNSFGSGITYENYADPSLFFPNQASQYNLFETPKVESKFREFTGALPAFPGFLNDNIDTNGFQIPSSYSSILDTSKLYENSPIYYIRLPPAPYKFVPGMGYVSQNPLSILPFQLPPMTNPNYMEYQPVKKSFLNLPLEFVSNGRPSNIIHYQNDEDLFKSLPDINMLPSSYRRSPIPKPLPSVTKNVPIRPTKNSLFKRLKGSLIFNGKPEHIYIHNVERSDDDFGFLK